MKLYRLLCSADLDLPFEERIEAVGLAESYQDNAQTISDNAQEATDQMKTNVSGYSRKCTMAYAKLMRIPIAERGQLDVEHRCSGLVQTFEAGAVTYTIAAKAGAVTYTIAAKTCMASSLGKACLVLRESLWCSTASICLQALFPGCGNHPY